MYAVVMKLLARSVISGKAIQIISSLLWNTVHTRPVPTKVKLDRQLLWMNPVTYLNYSNQDKVVGIVTRLRPSGVRIPTEKGQLCLLQNVQTIRWIPGFFIWGKAT
jgi:hypothetical protein